MKHSGFCNKCGSDDLLIFKGNDLWPHVRKNVLIRWLTREQSVHLDRYVCANCGYVAFWVDEPNKLQILKPHLKSRFFAQQRGQRASFLTNHITETLESMLMRHVMETKSQLDAKLNRTNNQISDIQNQFREEMILVNQRFSELFDSIYEIEKRLSDIEKRLS